MFCVSRHAPCLVCVCTARLHCCVLHCYVGTPNHELSQNYDMSTLPVFATVIRRRRYASLSPAATRIPPFRLFDDAITFNITSYDGGIITRRNNSGVGCYIMATAASYAAVVWFYGYCQWRRHTKQCHHLGGGEHWLMSVTARISRATSR